MSAVTFLLWSNKHGMWWRPGDCGYTADVDQAGRYSEAQAVERVVRSAMGGDLAQVTSMVAAPDNWADPTPTVRVVAGPGPLRDVLPEWLRRLAKEKATTPAGGQP